MTTLLLGAEAMKKQSTHFQNSVEGTPMKILIVDDVPEIVEVIGICLSIEWPQAVMVGASTGSEAISLAESEAPDMVLLDLGLPDMDGLDVLEEMRKHSSAPVIIVSARKQEKDQAEGIAAGADDYVAKPFSFKELMDRAGVVWQRTIAAPKVMASQGSRA